ncbi:TauD/TfdA family dioxygenase [Novosphingobium sp. G106]|uniref:TauD/TfdA dioxygenase family protein n=1 Tax=Novosphingobium sp. G106 TaxID=2849500 RepID=UPI001C2DA493|nr:TauD/TfdA family dioxygenase [Novosphingobium sp. G106]MBV1689181.1 TauD/TfdA family dioxygenase [Novosphingobium sp. G106]
MATVVRDEQTTLTVTPLTGSIGARIEGVDLSRDLDQETADAIRRAFAEHAVLVFRSGRDATPEEQHRLAALSGEPQPLQVFQFLGRMQAGITFDPGSRIVASDAASAPKQSAQIKRQDLQSLGIAGEFDGWHSDSSFCHFLPKAAVLRAEVIAPVGGDTGFASLCAAYEALSPIMQGWLEDLRAVHIIPEGFKDGINLASYGADAEERFDAFFPPKEWPLVVRHPETGRKALWINPGYTAHIVGLKRAESHALIRFLARHISSTSFTYRHHWQKGDLVVWDEVFALHRAPDDFAPHERKVVRVTAGRQKPTA